MVRHPGCQLSFFWLLTSNCLETSKVFCKSHATEVSLGLHVEYLADLAYAVDTRRRIADSVI